MSYIIANVGTDLCCCNVLNVFNNDMIINTEIINYYTKCLIMN